MFIKVKVFPASKINSLEKKSDNSFEIKTKEKAEKGKANKAVRKMLADYFGIPEGRIRLVKGAKRHHKIFEIKNG